MKKFEFYCGQCGFLSSEKIDKSPICKGETSKYGPHQETKMKYHNREDLRLKQEHPIQPLEDDGNAVLRFKQNNIVRYLLDHGSIGLNQLALIDFPKEDHEQFAQLIGYSLSGFGDLSFVSDSTFEKASKSGEPAVKVIMEKLNK